MFKISVDDGYGSIKVAIRNEKGKISTHEVPTHFMPGAHYGVMNPKDETFDTMVIQSGDSAFTVGDPNRHGATEFDGFPLAAANRAIVRFAIAKAGIKDGDKFALSVGLPIGQYFMGDKRNADLIDKKIAHHMEPVYRVIDKDTKIPLSAPESVRCLPQSVIVGLQSLPEDMSTFAVVDIGYRTTDITVLANDRVAFNRCGGLMDIGVSTAQAAFRRAIESRFAMNFETGYETAFKQKQVRISGTRHDVSAEWETVVRDTAETIRQAVEKIVRPIHDIDGILLIGGGAKVFFDALSEHWPQVRQHDNPVFANALAWLEIEDD